MIFKKGIFKTYDSFQWLGDAELEITAVNVTLMMISTADKFLKKIAFLSLRCKVEQLPRNKPHTCHNNRGR